MSMAKKMATLESAEKLLEDLRESSWDAALKGKLDPLQDLGFYGSGLGCQGDDKGRVERGNRKEAADDVSMS